MLSDMEITKLQLNKLSVDILPQIIATNFSKNQFSTVLSRLEHLGLVL